LRQFARLVPSANSRSEAYFGFGSPFTVSAIIAVSCMTP
jgi:hypothetical protein